MIHVGPLLLPPVHHTGDSRWLLRSAMASNRIQRKKRSSFLQRQPSITSPPSTDIASGKRILKKWVKLIGSDDED